MTIGGRLQQAAEWPPVAGMADMIAVWDDRVSILKGLQVSGSAAMSVTGPRDQEEGARAGIGGTETISRTASPASPSGQVLPKSIGAYRNKELQKKGGRFEFCR